MGVDSPMEHARFRVTLDCLVIGAGVAGLTAAVHLCRLGRRVLVAQDPQSHEVKETSAGRRDPSPRQRLLEEYYCRADGLIPSRVRRIELDAHGALFSAAVGTRRVLARSLLLATGAAAAPLPFEAAPALHRHRLLFDAGDIEFPSGPVAALASDRGGVEFIIGLRQRGHRPVLLDSTLPPSFSARALWPVRVLDIPVLQDKIVRVDHAAPSGVVLHAAGGQSHAFTGLINALPRQPRSELARQLGAMIKHGAVVADPNGRTNVSGLFAAGAVVAPGSALATVTRQATLAAVAIERSLASGS